MDPMLINGTKQIVVGFAHSHADLAPDYVYLFIGLGDLLVRDVRASATLSPSRQRLLVHEHLLRLVPVPGFAQGRSPVPIHQHGIVERTCRGYSSLRHGDSSFSGTYLGIAGHRLALDLLNRHDLNAY